MTDMRQELATLGNGAHALAIQIAGNAGTNWPTSVRYANASATRA